MLRAVVSYTSFPPEGESLLQDVAYGASRKSEAFEREP